MTVPTLVDGERVLADSRDILLFAFGQTRESLDAETVRWVAAQYAFPIEELTFAWLLGWNALARRAVPRSLVSAEAQLRTLAKEHPDLADAYLRARRGVRGAAADLRREGDRGPLRRSTQGGARAARHARRGPGRRTRHARGQGLRACRRRLDGASRPPALGEARAGGRAADRSRALLAERIIRFLRERVLVA